MVILADERRETRNKKAEWRKDGWIRIIRIIRISAEIGQE